MRRFILTGTPGAGKTTIIRQLKHDGFKVVDEAATDVIASEQSCGITEPWKHSSFIDKIALLQKQRQLITACESSEIQFYDRSVICTVALATYLQFPISDTLFGELERIRADNIFERRVFFVYNLGFITPTDARQITLDDALRFEKIHEEIYCKFGFDIVPIKSGHLLDRVAVIKEAILREFRIRRAAEEDATAILNVHCAAVHGTASAFYDQDILNDWSPTPAPLERIRDLAARIKSGEEVMLVAENRTNQIVAFSSIFPSLSELRAVYVHPDYGKQGLGGRLLEEIERLTTKSGLLELSMDSSINAERFYSSHGYYAVQRGEHILRSGRRMACVKMKKVLKRPDTDS